MAAITSTGDVEQYREATLAAHHQDGQYWAPATAKQQKMEHNCYSLQTECENVCFEQFPFIKRWLGDASARAFQRIDSIPPSKSGITVPTGVYNTWPGFFAETLPPVPDDAVQELVRPVLNHIRDVITGPDHLGYVIAWLAQQVQEPATPTGVAIVLHGLEGTGKDIIFDFFIHKVLGERTGFKTSNPSKDIFGDHSVALQNRVLVLVDEASGEVMRPIKERVKDLITSSTVHINKKNRDPYDIRNLTNMVLTSNQQNPVQIDPQERRFVVFETNASKKGDSEYFQGLGQHLKRDVVSRGFFQYLRDHVDVRPYTPFQAHRPKTDAYAAMQQRNIPLFCKFLSAQAEYNLGPGGSEQTVLMGKEIYHCFLEWGREGNYTTKNFTMSRFGSELQKFITEMTATDPLQNALTKRRSGGGQRYTVNWRKLRAALQATARYDPNAAV